LTSLGFNSTLIVSTFSVRQVIMPASSSSSSATKTAVKETAVSPAFDPEQAPPLTRELLLGYEASHHRLLLWLGLVMACFLAIFPVSDPDIFFSLQTGRMISEGTFPFGQDPMSYAEGEQSQWIHNGWLGDLIIYQLFKLGGGPLLVIFRALLVGLLFCVMMKLAGPTPKFLTVLAIILGLLALGQRMNLRTELFSIVLLGVTVWVLHHQPPANCWCRKLSAFTGGKLYWLLPVIFVFWANIDGWFFLGLIVVALWTMGVWTNRNKDNQQQVKSLVLCTVLSFVACLVTPFHFKSYVEIPNRLMPATGTVLEARFQEMRQNNPKLKMSEQLRFFASPITPEYFQNTRAEQIAVSQLQAPFLGIFYPLGLSISEWAFYPLLIVVLGSFISGSSTAGVGRTVLLLVFIGLGVWQSRFVGFFVAVGVSLAVLNFQSTPREKPSLSRGAILGNQLLCLLLGLLIQFCTILHLVPSNDFSTSALGAASIGYVHPRGTFGFAFRSDPSIEQACLTIRDWRSKNLLFGKTFHYDWTDVVAYDSWFNPGARHFFDRRHEVHDLESTRDYLLANDAILSVIRDANTGQAAFDQQARWQEVFKKHDISHIVVKRRMARKLERDQIVELELVRSLLTQRDSKNLPVWSPLKLHNGQVYALAWVGSPHWPALQKLVYNSEAEVFRSQRDADNAKTSTEEAMNFSRFLAGDPPRRPAALDESSWHLFYSMSDSEISVARAFASFDVQLRNIMGQLQARLATPVSSFPYFPVWLSTRQSSSAPFLLSLDAIRRAVREITPETTPAQRAEIWLQYLSVVTKLADYEQVFLPIQSRYREPLVNFVLRQAAYASAEVNHEMAFPLNMDMAKIYVNSGLLDAGLEHVQMALEQVNRQKEILKLNGDVNNVRIGQVDQLLKNFDSFSKQQYGFAPTELENEVKQRTDRWKMEIAKLPKSNDPGKDILARADLAFQLGLPRLAIEQLLTSTVKSEELALLATAIYAALGQHDLVLTEFFNRSPALQNKLGDSFLNVAALGEWCLGRPERAAEYRQKLAQQMDSSSLQMGLNYGLASVFGTSPQPAGNVLDPIFRSQQTAQDSMRLADQYISAGLLYLEGGKPQQAAALFKKVLQDIEPNTPWRLLLERYLLQITGEVFQP
jgi:tetratricopeptide (TPR) repeat protein